MSEIIQVDIHGSCVTRDAFELYPEQFKVKTYISRNSIFAFTSDSIPLGNNDFTVQHEFLRRMIVYDFNKTGLQALAASPSKYLIIDLIDDVLIY